MEAASSTSTRFATNTFRPWQTLNLSPQRLARHSTSKLTDRYTHVAIHDIVGAVESLPEPLTPEGTTPDHWH
jgi:hypothetical protein